jgi:hypothetical protein
VTPDTVITLTSGQICRVRESAEEVVERIVAFRRRICCADAAVDEPSEDTGKDGAETPLSQASG